MSTTLLYHGFGIHGYQYVHTKYHHGAIHFRVRQEVFNLRCPVCGSSKIRRRGQVMRRFRTVPIGPRPVWIELLVPRVFCHLCGIIRQVRVRFAFRRRSYTRAFERYALELSQHMTIKDVARHLGVSWDVIKDIQKRNLMRRFAFPQFHKLKQIAIDEISIGKGHRYLTIVLDLKSGAVVYVGEGKGAEALKRFWKILKRQKVHIEAVATDLSPAYISAVHSHLPKAVHVFDHFHLIKLFNDGLSDLRRKLYHEAERMQRHVLKGSRWLLLKNPENLDPKYREQERLAAALELNQPLALAYYMKEDLRQIWMQSDKTTATKILHDWVHRAFASGISTLIKFAKTVAMYRSGILAFYDYPISTGPLEGTNNKIKTMKRQAYGFRDLEFFKLKILALHNAKYALVG
jgi:transposase